MTLTDRLQHCIREVPDFPIEGVLFKDISPIFLDPQLVRDCATELADRWRDQGITKIVGIDSRGFLFGPQMAGKLEAGFVLVRKKGKLPPETIGIDYDLEYGSASLEVNKGGIQAGDRVIIHDDLLATGGTAGAAAALAHKLGAIVVGFSFLVELSFLKGQEKISSYSPEIHSLIGFDK
ncbi:MAG: adenine phosphoribosyltransferase [Bacteroidota bacterium]